MSDPGSFQSAAEFAENTEDAVKGEAPCLTNGLPFSKTLQPPKVPFNLVNVNNTRGSGTPVEQSVDVLTNVADTVGLDIGARSSTTAGAEPAMPSQPEFKVPVSVIDRRGPEQGKLENAFYLPSAKAATPEGVAQPVPVPQREKTPTLTAQRSHELPLPATAANGQVSNLSKGSDVTAAQPGISESTTVVREKTAASLDAAMMAPAKNVFPPAANSKAGVESQTGPRFTMFSDDGISGSSGAQTRPTEHVYALANATMEDSLDFDHDGARRPENPFDYDSFNTAGGFHGAENDGDYMRKMQENTMSEEWTSASDDIFNTGGLDFLETAGSKSGTPDSEYARQSLYVKFDPMVQVPAGPGGVPSFLKSAGPNGSGPVPPSGGAGMPFKQPFPVQGHAATTEMIAALQQKQNAMRRQQTGNMDEPKSLPQQRNADPCAQQPSSWPDIVTRREPTPFANMKSSPQLPQQPHTPMSHASSASRLVNYAQNSSQSQYYTPNSGSGDYRSVNGDAVHGGSANDIDYEPAEGGPPGSLVNLIDSPQRPVSLRTKTPSNHMSAAKQMHRRSVPAGFLDGRESHTATMVLEPHDEYGLPEIPVVWENVVATYEGLVQNLLNKLKQFQDETVAAKQREARAIKDQEEMHRSFVGLHERFEANKNVIVTYKTNQDTLQKAFDDLNGEFQPVLQENKKVQAAMRLCEMKMRQMELELDKKNEENAELTKIVDDLISKDS